MLQVQLLSWYFGGRATTIEGVPRVLGEAEFANDPSRMGAHDEMRYRGPEILLSRVHLRDLSTRSRRDHEPAPATVRRIPDVQHVDQTRRHQVRIYLSFIHYIEISFGKNEFFKAGCFF